MERHVGPQDGHSHLLRLPSGRRFCVAEFGDPAGIPVLAFHGAPACRLMFDVTDGAARSLGLRIVAFDRPGYGHSPLDYGASLASRTEAFVELVNELGLDRFAVLGVSGGGPYAVSMAARLPHRVMALALISPLGPLADIQHRGNGHATAAGHDGAARPSARDVHLSFGHRAFFLDLPHHSWLLRVNAEIAMRSFRAAPRFFAHTFAHLLPESDRRIVALPDVERSIVDMTLEATRTGIGGGIADLEIYAAPWGVEFDAIAAPTQIWQGLDDLIVPVAGALELGNLIDGSRVHRIEKAGHFWVYSEVPSVLGALKDMAVGAPVLPEEPISLAPTAPLPVPGLEVQV